MRDSSWKAVCWESFIIRLDILNCLHDAADRMLRIFHYSPWYTYTNTLPVSLKVENLSLFALIYLNQFINHQINRWESFIIRLDILNTCTGRVSGVLRIFHYSPWYTYGYVNIMPELVENLSLFALIYLIVKSTLTPRGWESFIIRLDILNVKDDYAPRPLRIFHYSPWYT